MLTKSSAAPTVFPTIEVTKRSFHLKSQSIQVTPFQAFCLQDSSSACINYCYDEKSNGIATLAAKCKCQSMESSMQW
eukprot:296567-Pelagomonas_calceolata.AAC.1